MKIRFGRVRNRLAAALMLLGLGLLCTQPALAERYPAHGKHVTIIVPYPAGGPGDLLARAVANALRDQLKATFIVENKPGAAQILAMRAAAHAAPDGYTLVLGSTTSLVINPITKKALAYHPLEDFVPISLLSNSPQYLIARPNLPANTIRELIDLAKKSPGKLTYASLGPGSTANIAGELLNTLAGISIRQVPYPGAAPALRDVMAGFVDMTYTTNVLGMIRAGQVKALGITSPVRAKAVPEIPSIADSGMPDYDVGIWMGLAAPAGTPREIIDVLHDGIQKAVGSGELKSMLGSAGAELELSVTTPEEFRNFIQAEGIRWGKLIAAVKLAND